MTVVAHGGTLGLIAELSVGVVVVALVGFVWFREKRRQARDGRRSQAQMHDVE